MKFGKVMLVVLLLGAPLMSRGQGTQIYSYQVLSGGYAPNSNVTSYVDQVTGTWSMQYDGLNRLQGASATSGPYNSAVMGWQYDSFGNRLNQTVAGNPSVAIPSVSATYSSNNQVSTSNFAPNAQTITYDYAGNMTYDGINQVLYDAESRVCATAVYNAATMNTKITLYLYDAEGRRVAKGHPVTNTNTLYCPTSRADFAPDETYILGQNGEQVSELDSSGNWKHSNVYSGGQLLATYDQEGANQPLHFNISDPLGTKRIQTTANGVVELTCLSLPFGDGLTCTGPGQDATEHHFTGKERDTETGDANGNNALDYFGARYYASTAGRWMSPDWSASQEPIPYAKLDSPQTLNLYGYVGNNPLSYPDPDGHLEAQWHFLITLVAALKTGHGPFGSIKLAAQTSAVDWRNGLRVSQGTDAEHANWHAMEGILPNGDTQTAVEARAGTAKIVSDAMERGDTALALHAVEDLATPLHDGHAWTGINLSFLKHFLGDNFPVIGTIEAAFKNAVEVLQNQNPIPPPGSTDGSNNSSSSGDSPSSGGSSVGLVDFDGRSRVVKCTTYKDGYSSCF